MKGSDIPFTLGLLARRAKLAAVSEEASTPDKRPAMRASDADRERVAQVLHDALGEGRITMHELEERLDTVYAAKTIGELAPVTSDLPAEANQPAEAHQAQAHVRTGPDSRIGGHAGSHTSIALMSGAARKGNWVLPAQHNSLALMGGVEIDLREARFAEKQCTITAVAIMGGIEIVVPEDVIVEVNGIGLMGAFESTDKGGSNTPPPTAPRVKVTGLALMGAVEVVRKPRKSERRKHREIED